MCPGPRPVWCPFRGPLQLIWLKPCRVQLRVTGIFPADFLEMSGRSVNVLHQSVWDFLDTRAIPWRKGVMAVRFHEVLKRSDKNLGSFERTNKPSIPRLPRRNERKFI